MAKALLISRKLSDKTVELLEMGGDADGGREAERLSVRCATQWYDCYPKGRG